MSTPTIHDPLPSFLDAHVLTHLAYDTDESLYTCPDSFYLSRMMREFEWATSAYYSNKIYLYRPSLRLVRTAVSFWRKRDRVASTEFPLTSGGWYSCPDRSDLADRIMLVADDYRFSDVFGEAALSATSWQALMVEKVSSSMATVAYGQRDWSNLQVNKSLERIAALAYLHSCWLLAQVGSDH